MLTHFVLFYCIPRLSSTVLPLLALLYVWHGIAWHGICCNARRDEYKYRIAIKFLLFYLFGQSFKVAVRGESAIAAGKLEMISTAGIYSKSGKSQVTICYRKINQITLRRG